MTVAVEDYRGKVLNYVGDKVIINGEVMITAVRLEELSRTVGGGFLASRAAMERF